MKESTNAISVKFPKFKYSETDNGDMVAEVDTAKIVVPNNVLDTEYFRTAVQYHIYVIGEKVLNGKYLSEYYRQKKLGNKVTASQVEKLRKLKSEKELYVTSYIQFSDSLDNIYSDSTEAIASFMSDGFAELFALWILGEKSYVIESSDMFGDGNTDTVFFHFPDESKVSGFIADFAEDVTPQQKKTTVNAVNVYCNTHFKTYGGEIYKNITYNISQKLLHDELFSRSKKQLKTDKKGRGIVNVTLTNYELALQLFSICMYTLGIPFYNGKSITYIQNVGVKPESVVIRPITKKEKEQADAEKAKSEQAEKPTAKTGNKNSKAK